MERCFPRGSPSMQQLALFSGTPPLNQPGTLALTVTASDGSFAVSDTFTLNVAPVNDAPVLASLIADQTVAEEAAWAFTVPTGTFTDADSSLTYTAILANGSALPSWLSFDAANSDILGHATSELYGPHRSQSRRQRRSVHRIRHLHPDRYASQRRSGRLRTDPRSGGLAWVELVVPGSYGGAFSDVDRDGLTYIGDTRGWHGTCRPGSCSIRDGYFLGRPTSGVRPAAWTSRSRLATVRTRHPTRSPC